MKKFLGIFAVVFIISCSKNPVPKPDNLLDEEAMVDIIYDISILQATDGSMPYKLTDHNIKMDQYIFEKYKIDSITYRENQRYYAANARAYKKIYKKVIERLDKENPANTQGINNETSVGVPNSAVE